MKYFREQRKFEFSLTVVFCSSIVPSARLLHYERLAETDTGRVKDLVPDERSQAHKRPNVRRACGKAPLA